jgi:transmembrane sensor
VAAFTLGRVLLTRLGRPREAAAAFAGARARAPAGSLAEDALAREVEAWARAGELQRARARARQYLRSYPSGRRASSVRKHARLE